MLLFLCFAKSEGFFEYSLYLCILDWGLIPVGAETVYIVGVVCIAKDLVLSG